MTVIQLPVRLDRVQKALVQVFDEATGVSTFWSEGNAQHQNMQSSFISLHLLSGPTPTRKNKRGRVIIPIESVVIAIPTVVVDTRYGFYLNDFLYYYDSQSGDTQDTVRDALVLAVNNDSYETVTATATTSGKLSLVADFVGGIQSLHLFPPTANESLVYSPSRVQLTEGAQIMVVTVSTFSKIKTLRGGAHLLAAQCSAALQSEDFVETLRALGIGVQNKSPLINLGAITSGDWESRVAFDVTFAVRSAWVRNVDTIETVVSNTDS